MKPVLSFPQKTNPEMSLLKDFNFSEKEADAILEKLNNIVARDELISTRDVIEAIYNDFDDPRELLFALVTHLNHNARKSIKIHLMQEFIASTLG